MLRLLEMSGMCWDLGRLCRLLCLLRNPYVEGAMDYFSAQLDTVRENSVILTGLLDGL